MVTTENFDMQVLSLDSLEKKQKQHSNTNLFSTINNRRIKKRKSQTITHNRLFHKKKRTIVC
jgi:hypothetical protein